MRGFTLIELMIVAAIIGMISAIAIPAYQRHKCIQEGGMDCDVKQKRELRKDDRISECVRIDGEIFCKK